MHGWYVADGFNNQNHFRLPKQEHKCETASMYGMRKDDENNRQPMSIYKPKPDLKRRRK